MNYIIEIIKSSFPNPTIAIMVIAVVLLSLWLYKEIRNSYLENMKLNQQRANKAIDFYSELELEIYKYLNDKSNFINVTEKMSKASSIMPYEILKECTRCKQESDAEKRKEFIKAIHSKIYEEIVNIKLIQTDPYTFKPDDSVKLIESFLKTKIAPFFYPLIQTFLV